MKQVDENKEWKLNMRTANSDKQALKDEVASLKKDIDDIKKQPIETEEKMVSIKDLDKHIEINGQEERRVRKKGKTGWWACYCNTKNHIWKKIPTKREHTTRSI